MEGTATPHWLTPRLPATQSSHWPKPLHLLVQLRIAQKLFHFRARLARGGTVRAFGQSPHQHGGKGGIVSGLYGDLQHHKRLIQHDNSAGKGPIPA